MPELLISCGDGADDTGLRVSNSHSFIQHDTNGNGHPPPPPPPLQLFSIQSHLKKEKCLQCLVVTLEGGM